MEAVKGPPNLSNKKQSCTLTAGEKDSSTQFLIDFALSRLLISAHKWIYQYCYFSDKTRYSLVFNKSTNSETIS